MTVFDRQRISLVCVGVDCEECAEDADFAGVRGGAQAAVGSEAVPRRCEFIARLIAEGIIDYEVFARSLSEVAKHSVESMYSAFHCIRRLLT